MSNNAIEDLTNIEGTMTYGRLRTSCGSIGMSRGISFSSTPLNLLTIAISAGL